MDRSYGTSRKIKVILFDDKGGRRLQGRGKAVLCHFPCLLKLSERLFIDAFFLPSMLSLDSRHRLKKEYKAEKGSL